jgi:phosphoenolpyruvate-protein kinase (PTS system EI component)
MTPISTKATSWSVPRAASPARLVDAGRGFDTGGVISHGAILPRELGVTCVINSDHGTRDIPDRARISVDGSSDCVIIHEPTGASEANSG